MPDPMDIVLGECNRLDALHKGIFKAIDALLEANATGDSLKTFLATLAVEKAAAFREASRSLHAVREAANVQLVKNVTAGNKSSSLDVLSKISTGRGSFTGNAGAFQILFEVASHNIHTEERRKELVGAFTREEISRIIKFFNDSFEFAREDLGFMRKRSTVKKIRMRKGSKVQAHSSNEDDEEDVVSTSVVVFGSVNMDLMTTAPTFPTPNSNEPGVDFQTLHGGKGANEAVACGRLEVPTYLIGRVGLDDFGKMMISSLSEDCNVDGVTIDHNERTGVAIVIKAADTKLKTTSTCLAANTRVDHDEVTTFENYITSNNMGIEHTLLQLEVNVDSVAQAAKLAHNAGKSVTIRTSPLSNRDNFPASLWKHTHFVIANESEAVLLLTPEEVEELKLGKSLHSVRECALVAERIVTAHPALIAAVILTPFGVVTRVKSDAVANFATEDYDVRNVAQRSQAAITMVLPHFSVKIVDVIGAGDALSGAFVAALAWDCGIPHALVWGQIALAKSMEVAGAQKSMPTLAGMRKFMADNGVGVHCQWMIDDSNGPNTENPRWPSTNPTVHPALMELENLLYEATSTINPQFSHALDVLMENNKDLGEHLNDPIDYQGQNLLHLAVMFSDLSAVCALLKHGASVTITDGYGVTVMDRAILMYGKYRIAPGSAKALKKRSAHSIDETAALIKIAILASWFVLQFTTVDPADVLAWPFEKPISACKDLPASLVAALDDHWDENWCNLCLNMMMLTALSRESRNMRLAPITAKYQPVAELGASLTKAALSDSVGKPRSPQMRWIRGNVSSCKVLGNTVGVMHAAAYVKSVDLLSLAHDLPIEAPMRKLPEMSDVSTYEDIPLRNISIDSFSHLSDSARRDKKIYWWYKSDENSPERSPLHFAALSSAEDCAIALLDWGMDIYDRDRHGLSAIDYCVERHFARRLEELGLVSDTFISVGHTAKTDECVRQVATALEGRGATVWWDRNPNRGIEAGSSWTSEINQAMKHSKTAIIMLTKKWIASEFCIAEAKLALGYNKPIFTVLPPVPPEERATLNDIPQSSAIYAAIAHKQFFDFSSADPNSLRDNDALLDKLYLAVVKSGRLNQKSVSVKSNRLDTDGAITNIMTPTIPIRRSLFRPDSYVLVSCGLDPASYGEDRLFAEVLASKLTANGIPVVVAYKAPPSNADEYWTAVNNRVKNAALVIAVLDDEGDAMHMQSVLEIASQKQTPGLIVPFSKLTNSRGTDWIGHDGGFSEHSPIFGESFHALLRELDESFIGQTL